MESIQVFEHLSDGVALAESLGSSGGASHSDDCAE
jgi:hypothetical protein